MGATDRPGAERLTDEDIAQILLASGMDGTPRSDLGPHIHMARAVLNRALPRMAQLERSVDALLAACGAIAEIRADSGLAAVVVEEEDRRPWLPPDAALLIDLADVMARHDASWAVDDEGMLTILRGGVALARDNFGPTGEDVADNLRSAAAGILARQRPTPDRMYPHSIVLCAELRRAVGMFDGAMPISPRQAWDEAIARVRELADAARGGR